MNIVEQFKKGYATSEFWIMVVTLAGSLAVPIFGVEVDTEGAIGLITAIFGAASYAGSRTWLKRARVNALAVSAEPVYPPDADDTLVTGLPEEMAP